MSDTCDMLHHSKSGRVAAGTGIGRESSVLAMISASGARACEGMSANEQQDRGAELDRMLRVPPKGPYGASDHCQA